MQVTIHIFPRLLLGIWFSLWAGCSSGNFSSGGKNPPPEKAAGGGDAGAAAGADGRGADGKGAGSTPGAADAAAIAGLEGYRKIAGSQRVLDNSRGSADIVFVLDGSESMKEEMQLLQENMGRFLAYFEKKAKIDYRVVLVGDSFDFPGATSIKTKLVQETVDSGEALAVLKNLLTAQKDLRPGVPRQIVIITDDNDKISSLDFTLWAQQNAAAIGEVHLNGFVGLPNSQQIDRCRIAGPGSAYSEIAASPAYSGLVQDLCQSNWGGMLDSLAARIIAQDIAIEITVEEDITPANIIVVLVGGKALPPNAAKIDYDRNTIVINGAGISPTTEIQVLTKS